MFLTIAISDFVTEFSGTGVVFFAFSAVYLGLALSEKEFRKGRK